MPCPPAPIASDSCQTYPSVGAMAGLPNQPLSGAHHSHQYATVALPGAVNVSASETTAALPDGKHFAVVSSYYPHQQFYGYAQGMGTVANSMHDQSHGYHVLTSLAPAPAFPTDSSVASGGKNSLTVSLNYFIFPQCACQMCLCFFDSITANFNLKLFLCSNFDGIFTS